MSITQRLLILPIIITFSINAFSQVYQIDSLKSKLEKQPTRDTARVNTLFGLAFAHFRHGESEVLPYLIEVEQISDSLDYTLGKAKYSYLRGILHSIRSEYSKSLEFFNRSLNHYKSIDDKRGMAVAYTAFGNTHFALREYEEAIATYEKASEMFLLEKDVHSQIIAKTNIANVYLQMGSYNQALVFYEEAKKMAQKHNFPERVAAANSSLGVVYEYQGNYPLAIEYYNKALEYSMEQGNNLEISSVLSNLGGVYLLSKNYEKALDYNWKSLKYSTKIGNRYQIGNTYNNIGRIYASLLNFEKALKYYNKSLEISREINDAQMTSINLNNIGDMNLQLERPAVARKYFIESKDLSVQIGTKRQIAYSSINIGYSLIAEGKYKKALPFALEGKKFAEELDILDAQRKAEELLYKIYQKTGRFKEALASHERYKVLSDSLFNEENIKKITQIEYEYKYKNQLEAAKYKEMALTETVNETTDNLEKSQRNLLYGIIIFLAVTVLLGGIIFFLRLRNVKTRTENIITEQKLLRSQMTPHFIFNAMSVLQGIILNKEDTKAVSYLSKFSRLLRITLENSRDQLVSLKNELVAVENYIDLQNIEAKTPFVYSINIAENIDSEKVKIPPMLIQPFIENSIEHGFTDHEGEKKIEIAISRTADQLNCIITDNGVGVDKEKVSINRNKKSLSTAITTERIELLSKNSKSKGSISIEDRRNHGAQGTQVTMVIPYQVG